MERHGFPYTRQRLEDAERDRQLVRDAPLRHHFDAVQILRDEAWFVADRASDELKPQAVELALRLDELAHSAAPTGIA